MADTDSEGLWLSVTQREALTDHIMALELRHPHGVALPPFEAGAHITIEVPDGSGRKRAYSLCHDPIDRSRYELAIQCEPHGRGGSLWLTQHIKVGDRLRVSLPRNLFAWRPTPHSLLVAGGIGLTPLLAMADMLWRTGQSFELHCAVRDRTRLPFAQRLAQAPWHHLVHLHIDTDTTGPHTPLDLPTLLASAPPGSVAYTCGPTGLMEAVQQAARRLSWPDERVVMERFTPPPDGTAARPTSTPEFEVHWAPTGAVIEVASHQSTAQALMAAGIPIDLSCEQGICGQCCVRVIDGDAEHHDAILTEAERHVDRCFTPCCSRATSQRLTLAPLNWRPDAPIPLGGASRPAPAGLPPTTWRQA